MFNQKEYLKQYYQDNKEKIKARSKRRRLDNPEYMKKWFLANPEYSKEHSKQWRINHPEQYKQYCQEHKKEKNEYYKNRYKNDSKFNINVKIKTAMNLSLKDNKSSRKWETLVGYILTDLVIHLKKTIPEGCTWQDFLNGKLHIDHIVPKSAFNFTELEHTDFKRCWALENLRLLPEKENISKHTKLYKPFQPALAI